MLRHENLVALIQQSDLLAQWNLHRAPVLRLKDAIWARLFRAPTREERIDAFVGLLQQRLWVDTGPDTLSMGIHFPDPDLAYRDCRGGA